MPQVTVRHVFQSAKADSADGTLVQPSHWNQDHFVEVTPVVESVFGRKGDVVAKNGDYTAQQVTNAVSTEGNYNDPDWINSLAWSKIQGGPSTFVTSIFGRSGSVTSQAGDYTAAQVTNAVSTAGSYADPPWIASLNWSKVVSPPNFVVDPLTTKGDLLVRSATATTRLAAGADGLILMADSAQALGVKWVAAGAGFQTPWLTNINGGGFDLSNVANITATTSILSSGNLSAGGNINAVGIITAAASVSTPLIQSVSDLIFRVGSETPERMRITAGGNVGIGTVNPQAPAHFKVQTLAFTETLRLENAGDGADNGAMIAWMNASSTFHAGELGFRRSGASLRQDLVFNLTSNWGTTAPTEKIRFTGDGNVGIATNSPGSALDVRGEASVNSSLRIWRNPRDAYYNLITTDGINCQMIYSVGPTAIMTWTYNGNVGIGTVNPLASMHLVRSDGSYELKLETSGAVKTYGFAVTGAGALTIDDVTAGSSRLFISTAGNVGIGMSNPTSKLHVQGDLKVVDTVSGNVSFTTDFSSGYHGTLILKSIAGANLGFNFQSPTTVWGMFANTTNFIINDADGLQGVQLAQNATAWTAYSDEREKNVIGRISNALHKVCNLRGVEFTRIGDDLRRVGLVAQDVQKVLPEAIDESNPDKLGIRYTEVIPLLVEAIRELERRTV